MKKMYIFAALALLLDQASKYAVRAGMHVSQSIPLIPRVLHLTYARNTGAAFGILAGKRLFFIIASLMVVAMLLVYSREVKGSPRLQVAFGLMLGGAVGNLVDRILLRWVTDFIDFKIFPPIFNLADSALVVGVGLFALDMVLEWKRERQSAA